MSKKQDEDNQTQQEEYQLQEGFEALKAKYEDCESQRKRALADYQNLQKRVAEQRQELIRSANKELIIRLLPVLDTLMMAERHVQDQGLALSIQQFLDVLKNEGVERIKTIGESFDPKTMECIQTEVVEKEQDSKVIEEFRAGYKQYEKVLRAAQVKVGKLESSS